MISSHITISPLRERRGIYELKCPQQNDLDKQVIEKKLFFSLIFYNWLCRNCIISEFSHQHPILKVQGDQNAIYQTMIPLKREGKVGNK